MLCLAEGGDRGTAGAPNLPHKAFEQAFHKASPPLRANAQIGTNTLTKLLYH